MPWEPHDRNRNHFANVLSPGAAPQRLSQQEMQDMKYQLERQSRFLEQLQKEPRLCAVIVDIREGSMLISFGPGNSVDVQPYEGAQVGDRLLVKRDTMQGIELIHDDVPTGTVVTIERVGKTHVEALLLGQLRSFMARKDRDGKVIPVKVGERVVLDPSQAYVIGTLGMPQTKHAIPPKVSVGWDDIGGHAEAKYALREAIELPLLHKDLFSGYGQRPIKGVLLEGAPGNGKTLLGKAAATAIARVHGHTANDGGFMLVNGPEVLNKFVGETELAIRNIFAAARTHHTKHGYPAVIFIDEADALLGKRDRSPNMSMGATIVPQFLAEMDGLNEFAAMVILATNRADMLDPAIVRDGRIDRRIKVVRPGAGDARAIFEIHMRGRPLATPLPDAGDLVDRMIAELYSDDRVVKHVGDGFVLRVRDFVSGAMIASIVDNATSFAIQRDIANAKKKPSGITADDFMRTIALLENALRHIDHDEVIREIILKAQEVELAARKKEPDAPAGGVPIVGDGPTETAAQ